jgi:putative hydrolase of the HAD superfamily
MADSALPAAVTFDVGGTLLSPWPSVGHAYAAVASRFGGGDLEPNQLEQRFIAAWKRRGPGFVYRQSDWQELVARVFDGVSPVGRSPDFFHALYQHFATPTPWRVFPDVMPTLTRLRDRGIKLAVISNWDDRLRPLLSALDLAQHFNAILVSAEAGMQKPDPAFFLEAARRLGVAVGEVAHVGDSPQEDLAGAQAAGMRAVLVNRDATQAGDHDLRRQCEAWF